MMNDPAVVVMTVKVICTIVILFAGQIGSQIIKDYSASSNPF